MPNHHINKQIHTEPDECKNINYLAHCNVYDVRC